MKFVWTTAAGAFLFEAKDKNDAFRRIMANRLIAAGYQNPDEAPLDVVKNQMGWFNKNDELLEIEGEGGMEVVFTADFPDG